MKKFFKIGCLGLIALLVLGIVIVLFSGNDGDDVSTGTEDSNSDTTEDLEKEDGTKVVDAKDESKEAAGMKVSLGDVKVEQSKLKVGINIENTTDEVLSFYPDQGSAVIEDMQLDANMFLTDGDIGGDVQGGVKQDGILEFLVPDGKEIDVENVNEIKLMFGDVTTEDFMTSEPVDFTIPVE